MELHTANLFEPPCRHTARFVSYFEPTNLPLDEERQVS